MAENTLGIIKQYAFVIRQISFKDNRRKTDETNLGMIWNVLDPLLYMIILSTYYQNVITHRIENFPVFVFTGITMIRYYTGGTKGAMRSLVGNKSLLMRTQIPMELFIVQKVFASFKEMLYSSVALIPIMVFFHIKVYWRVLQLIPILALTTIVIIGIGGMLAVAYTFFADIDYLYSIFMTLMLFVSGVFIPLDHMPVRLQGALTYNPIFLSIYLTRNSLMYNLPSHWTAWVKLLLWAIVAPAIGYYVFRNNRNKLVNLM